MTGTFLWKKLESCGLLGKRKQCETGYDSELGNWQAKMIFKIVESLECMYVLDVERNQCGCVFDMLRLITCYGRFNRGL